MKTESDFSRSISDNFSVYQRIDTKRKEGVPDVFYAIANPRLRNGPSYVGWAELKYIGQTQADLIDRKKSGVRVPDFKKEQSFWLQSKFMKGVVTHLLVGVGSTIYGFRGGNMVVTSGSKLWSLSEFCNFANFICKNSTSTGKQLRMCLLDEHLEAEYNPRFWDVHQRVMP